MGERHTLPSGQWVEVGSHLELTGKHYRAAIGAVTDWGRQGRWPIEVRTALAEALVQNWSYEQYPLPVTGAVLDMLPLADARCILSELMTPAFHLVTGRSVAPDAQQADDEASPTQGGSE